MINCNGSSFTGAELNLRAVGLPCLSLHFGRRGYVDAWNNGFVDNVMSFFDKKELQFANHGWFLANFSAKRPSFRDIASSISRQPCWESNKDLE